MMSIRASVEIYSVCTLYRVVCGLNLQVNFVDVDARVQIVSDHVRDKSQNCERHRTVWISYSSGGNIFLLYSVFFDSVKLQIDMLCSR